MSGMSGNPEILCRHCEAAYGEPHFYGCPQGPRRTEDEAIARLERSLTDGSFAAAVRAHFERYPTEDTNEAYKERVAGDVDLQRPDLDGLRRLSKAASSGYWSLGRRSMEPGRYPRPWAPQVWPRAGAPVATLQGRVGAPDKDEADAAFIVAAVNYVRRLLGEKQRDFEE